MSLILIVSILIRVIAVFWSVILWRQLRDWRMAFLMVMLVLMAARQIFTLTNDFQGWFINVSTHLDELPGLIVSILALIIVIVFQKILLEKKYIDKSIKESEERLQLVLDGSQDGHWYWDILEDNGWWSKRFYQILGYEDGEIPPTYESFFERLHPDDKDRMLEKQNEHLENKEPYDIEYRLLKKSGEYAWFRARGQAIWDKQGKPIHMAGSIQDINNRVKAVNKLQHSEKRLRSILDSMFTFVGLISLEGILLEVNRISLEVASLKREDVIGKKLIETYWISYSSETQGRFEEAIITAVSGKPVRYDEVIRTGDNSFINVDVTIAPIYDSDGHVIQLVGSAVDITERIKSEKALQFTQFAIDHFTDAAFWLGEEGQFVYVNDAACNSLGYSKEELLAMFVFDIDPKFKKEQWASYWQSTKGQYFRTFETVHQRKDGTIFPVEIASNHLEFEGKHYRCTFARNIQERKLAEASIQASEERYRMLYDNTPAMFFTIDKKLKVITVNHFGAERLGYNDDELIGKLILDVVDDADKNKAYECIQACFSKPNEIHRWKLRKVCKDGTVLWVRETARFVSDKDNKTRLFIVCEDISETHLLSEQLSYQATHDALTGLINRREFENRLVRIVDTSRKSKSEHVLCYLDLDQFKIINDSCGHFAGDSLLKEVSELIQKNVRKRDTLARLGGDEFGILMEHCNIEQAKNVANTLLKEVDAYRYSWEDKHFTIGVSMGLVTIDSSVIDHTEVLRNADAACYAAKDAGRNRIHIYSEDDADLAQRHGEMQWVNRIKHALDKDKFELYVQPIVSTDSTDNSIFKYEVLIRLIENNKTIAPGLFLPAAERYNLGSKIDRWVIDTIFKIFKENPEVFASVKIWSINLSGQSIADKDFLKFITNKLEKDVDIGKMICFEITETAAISNLQTAAGFMHSLKELGCQFSLDDFGSGLSSFAYLKTLPVDYLKIDGFFVKHIVEDEADYAMVKSINEISQVMGIESIAEFVENDAIKQKLVDIGVDYVQGYGIGKPEPLKDLYSNNKTT
jgi:diguanylate cyclase (GGDEF)-like protein/PAS domain S-box-containing protein